MRRLGFALLAVFCFAATVTAACAQDKYPSRTIRIVVPYAPGGSTDIVARIIGEQMRQILGQPVIVENKPGAFGIIAIEELNRSKPDGYTLMVGNVSTNAITPVLYAKKLSRPYETSVVPVMRLVDIPHFLLVTAKNFPPKSVAELVAYAKERPGLVRYGTVGVGSYPHYDMAVFARRAGGLDMTGIPNKAGASGVLNDMMTGDTQVAFLNVASSASMVQAGLIRPLALVNPQRLPEHPDVPTMAEVGFPGVGTSAWQVMVAPAGTPPEVLETIRKVAAQAMQAPSVIENFRKQNFNIVPSASLDEAKTWAAAEMAHWKQITEEVKIDVPE
jgi:tripartite-type tricarboxylate transporter receptor subunit TctC